MYGMARYRFWQNSGKEQRTVAPESDGLSAMPEDPQQQLYPPTAGPGEDGRCLVV
jgi:hypothetical protein